MTALTAALALTASAQAAADLETSITLPALSDVYVEDENSVRVDNVGRHNASDVELRIQLPETATSPQVYVLGDLGAVDSRCAEVGTELVCDPGRIRRGRSKTVRFDFAMPWSVNDRYFDADATTSSSESNLGNNGDTGVASVAYVDQRIAAPAGVTNRHCTGQGLQGFYECTLYPSSISTHDILLEADGSITFPPGISGYTGSWWQDTPDHLHFEYVLNGTTTRLIFDGNGVGGDCFEGISTFPGTPYSAGYEVCFREL